MTEYTCPNCHLTVTTLPGAAVWHPCPSRNHENRKIKENQ